MQCAGRCLNRAQCILCPSFNHQELRDQTARAELDYVLASIPGKKPETSSCALKSLEKQKVPRALLQHAIYSLQGDSCNRQTKSHSASGITGRHHSACDKKVALGIVWWLCQLSSVFAEYCCASSSKTWRQGSKILERHWTFASRDGQWTSQTQIFSERLDTFCKTRLGPDYYLELYSRFIRTQVTWQVRVRFDLQRRTGAREPFSEHKHIRIPFIIDAFVANGNKSAVLRKAVFRSNRTCNQADSMNTDQVNLNGVWWNCKCAPMLIQTKTSRVIHLLHLIFQSDPEKSSCVTVLCGQKRKHRVLQAPKTWRAECKNILTARVEARHGRIFFIPNPWSTTDMCSVWRRMCK